MTIEETLVPAPLRWAVRLLRGEAAALGMIGAYLLWQDFTATATDLLSAVLVTGFAFAAAAVLWFLGGALGRCRPAARAPAIVLQLMLLPIGYYMVQGGLGWLGVPLIGLGLGVVALLVSTPTNRALGFD